ncbi:MAG TPA: peroxiredoxin-like family protein [Trebonia sp.]
MSETIADQVAVLREAQAGQLPKPVLDIFTEEQAGLQRSPLPAGVITAGTSVVDTGLLDAHGQPTTLYAATGGGPAVLVFYRGAWCPYCNIALNTYQASLLPDLKSRGITLVAITPQKPDESLSLTEKNALEFPVLSDPGLKLADALGIAITPAPEVIAAQRQLGLDITEGNADGSTRLPMPTVIVLDAGHVARWVDVHPDYTERSETTNILAAVDQLPA